MTSIRDPSGIGMVYRRRSGAVHVGRFIHAAYGREEASYINWVNAHVGRLAFGGVYTEPPPNISVIFVPV